MIRTIDEQQQLPKQLQQLQRKVCTGTLSPTVSGLPVKEVIGVAITSSHRGGVISSNEACLAKSVHSLRSRLYLTERTLHSLAELERLTTGRPAVLSPCANTGDFAGADMPATSSPGTAASRPDAAIDLTLCSSANCRHGAARWAPVDGQEKSKANEQHRKGLLPEPPPPPLLTLEELCGNPRAAEQRLGMGSTVVADSGRPAEETDGTAQPPPSVRSRFLHRPPNLLGDYCKAPTSNSSSSCSHASNSSTKLCRSAGAGGGGGGGGAKREEGGGGGGGSGSGRGRGLKDRPLGDVQEEEAAHRLLAEIRACEKAVVCTEQVRERSQLQLVETARHVEQYADLLHQAEARLHEQRVKIDRTASLSNRLCRLEDERDRTLSQLDELEASLSVRQAGGSSNEVDQLRSQLKEFGEEKERLLRSGQRLTKRITHLEGELRTLETRLACEQKEKLVLKEVSESIMGQVSALVREVEVSSSSDVGDDVRSGAPRQAASGVRGDSDNRLVSRRPSGGRALCDNNYGQLQEGEQVELEQRFRSPKQQQPLPRCSLQSPAGVAADRGEGPGSGDSPEVLQRLRADVLNVLSDNVRLRAGLAEAARRSAEAEADAAAERAARIRDAEESKRTLEQARAEADAERMRCIELDCLREELERRLQLLACNGESRPETAARLFRDGRTGDGGSVDSEDADSRPSADDRADGIAARVLVADLRRQLNDRDTEIAQLKQLFEGARHMQLRLQHPSQFASSTPKTKKRSADVGGASLTHSLTMTATPDSRAGGGGGGGGSVTEAALRSRLQEQDAELSACRRKLAAASKQLAAAENQLKELRVAADEQAKQLTGTRGQLDACNAELKQKSAFAVALEGQLNDVRNALGEKSAAFKTLHRLHSDQCRHYSEENGLLEQQCAQYKKLTSDLEDDLSATRAILNDKLQIVQQHEQTICLLQQDVKQQQMEADRIVGDLETRMMSATERVREVEAALGACQSELQNCLKKYEAARGAHEQEATHRSGELELTEKKLQQVQKLLEVQSAHVCHLQTALEQCQRELEASESRARDAEVDRAELQEQLELVRRESSISQAKRDELECQVEAARAELEASRQQLASAVESIRRSQTAQSSLESQVDEARQELGKLKRLDSKRDADRRRLRAELDEATRALASKTDELASAEARLAHAEAELKEQAERSAACDGRLREAERDANDAAARLQEVQGALRAAQDERDFLDATLCDMRLALRRCQVDLAGKGGELDGLREQLLEQEQELQQRAEQVSQLDVTIRDHRAETERRIAWLENSLRETRAELERKAARVVQLEAETARLDVALRTQALELSSAEQQNRRLQQQFDQRAAAARELERHVDALEEQRESLLRSASTGAVLGGSAAPTRDGQSDGRSERHDATLLALERDLLRSQRARDELAAELQKLRDAHECCADEKHRLEAELERTRSDAEAQSARAAEQVRAELVADMSRTQTELERLQQGHRHEIERLEDVHKQLVQSNADMSADYRSKVKAIEDAERHLRRQLQASIEQIAQLKADLGVRSSMLRAANEALLVKESEIARLRAKLGAHDRKALAVQQPSENGALQQWPATAALPLLEGTTIGPMLSVSAESSALVSTKSSSCSSSSSSRSPTPPLLLQPALSNALVSSVLTADGFAVADNEYNRHTPSTAVTPASPTTWSSALASAEQLASGLIGRLQLANRKFGELDHMPSCADDDDERSSATVASSSYAAAAGGDRTQTTVAASRMSSAPTAADYTMFAGGHSIRDWNGS